MTSAAGLRGAGRWQAGARRLGRDLARLGWLTHRWPAVDEPDPARREAALRQVCGETPARAVLLAVAHADDETAWASSLLLRLGDSLAISYTTDSAPLVVGPCGDGVDASRRTYAAVRRAERDRALSLAGVRPSRVYDIGIVDQESVRRLRPLRIRFDELLSRLRPDVVVTHAYEGGHPDHDATACAVHMAVRARRRAGAPAPVILEFAGYHRRLARQRAYRFLPALRCESRTIVLSPGERSLKQRMYACYASQASVLCWYPADVERIRCAPQYDFAQPPNWEGVLYEALAVPGDPWRTIPVAALASPEELWAVRTR